VEHKSFGGVKKRTNGKNLNKEKRRDGKNENGGTKERG
jgi:hypothetical protein